MLPEKSKNDKMKNKNNECKKNPKQPIWFFPVPSVYFRLSRSVEPKLEEKPLRACFYLKQVTFSFVIAPQVIHGLKTTKSSQKAAE